MLFNIIFVLSVINLPRKVIAAVIVFILALTNVFSFEEVKNPRMDLKINRHFL